MSSLSPSSVPGERPRASRSPELPLRDRRRFEWGEFPMRAAPGDKSHAEQYVPRTRPLPWRPFLNFRNFACHRTQISNISLAVLSHRGAARDRHGRGTGCGGRKWRFRRGRQMRTAKSCGPDAPTLASSLRDEAQTTVTNKPDHRGEHEISRKPLRRECRVSPV
jgi:hypothetical protein